jgi:hypothetical protein
LARSSKSHIRNYNPLPWIHCCLRQLKDELSPN